MSESPQVPAKPEETPPRRWDPFDLFAQLETELDRLRSEGLPAWPFGRRLQHLMPLAAWAPRADFYEHDGDLVVKVELPGVAKENITVALEDGDLVIRGERQAEKEVKEEHYYRKERSSGSFFRRLPLPEGVKSDQITARHADGVLEVRVPKPAAAEPQPTTIPVK